MVDLVKDAGLWWVQAACHQGKLGLWGRTKSGSGSPKAIWAYDDPDVIPPVVNEWACVSLISLCKLKQVIVYNWCLQFIR